MIGAVQSTFSHSSLATFEKCPRQYHFRYVARIPVATEGIEAFLGKRVHEILERLYQFVGEGRVPSLERVLHRYHQIWEQHFDPDRVRIVRTEMTADDYRALGARCVSNYYRRHYPFDADETLGLEHRIHFALDPGGGYAMRGVIDRIARARDGTVEIHDFKTSRRVPRQQELDRDRQLALYELGVREALGLEGPFRLVWHFVMANQLRTSSRTPEALEDLRRETAELIDRVRGEREFEARPSALCSWCEYRELCPAGGGAVESPAEPDDGLPAGQLRLV